MCAFEHGYSFVSLLLLYIWGKKESPTETYTANLARKESPTLTTSYSNSCPWPSLNCITKEPRLSCGPSKRRKWFTWQALEHDLLDSFHWASLFSPSLGPRGSWCNGQQVFKEEVSGIMTAVLLRRSTAVRLWSTSPQATGRVMAFGTYYLPWTLPHPDIHRLSQLEWLCVWWLHPQNTASSSSWFIMRRFP